MFWLWQMLVMALPTSWRQPWMLVQVAQGPGDVPVGCTGMLWAALGREVPGAPLAGVSTLDGRHREVDGAMSREDLDSRTPLGKQCFGGSFSGVPAWGLEGSAGLSFLEAFFWWREHRTNQGSHQTVLAADDL